MADGVTLQTTVATPAAGTEIATDDCGAAGHAQIVKLGISADGDATPVNSDATNGLDVDVTRLPRGSKTFADPAPTTSAASVLAANASRKAAIFYNNGADTIYLGGSSGVTSSNGMPLVAGATLYDNVSTDAWWAIMASGTGDLRIIEVA